MTVLTPPASSGGAHRRPSAAGGRLREVVVAIMAIVGILVLMYPTIADWFATKAQEAEVTGYVEQMEAATQEERAAIIEAAHSYNEAIPQILLTDPYTAQDALAGRGGAYETYHQHLTLAGSTVMGRISVPSADINLPIYHGTDDGTLDKGVGHLFGSSLPVGGPTTHSVLTAHSGMAGSRLFNDLDQVEVGDVVSVEVLGESIFYQVYGIETVLPTEVASLKLEAGRDLITLVTCTPTGVNTHRLLVHAERVEPEQLPEPVRESLAGNNIDAGFPWWIVIVGAGIVVVVIVVLAVNRRFRSRR